MLIDKLSNYPYKLRLIAYSLWLIALIGCTSNSKLETRNSKLNQACFKETCFNIELADTDTKRAQGLMFREQLNKDTGMLFVYPKEGSYSFWMKNTLIPLDIIWIDKEMKIVHIENNVQPCTEDACQSYISKKKAQYILELNAGTAENIQFTVGEKIEWNN